MKDILRVVTVGNIDDGKSTLLGNLMVATGSVPEDELRSLTELSKKRGLSGLDYSLVLDGLQAERSQGITIDVAYRYLSTHKRRFIFADCPGHLQYLRNMITGASQSDLALLLVDVERGITETFKRHLEIIGLLKLEGALVLLNKMDRVGFSQEVFEKLKNQMLQFSSLTQLKEVQFIPVSALRGDNVSQMSEQTPWYVGKSLLRTLEDFVIPSPQSDFRFSVQGVVRNAGKRYYLGTVLCGSLTTGEAISLLPSGQSAKVEKIFKWDTLVPTAKRGDCLGILLEEELDVTRGDLFCSGKIPRLTAECQTNTIWLQEPLPVGTECLIKIPSQKLRAWRTETGFKFSKPLPLELYSENRSMGRFVVIDLDSKQTSACALVTEIPAQASPHVHYRPWEITRQKREQRNGQRGAVLWFTGLPSSGKTTLAQLLGKELFTLGYQVSVLDGDLLRTGLCRDLGFTAADRAENLRRAAEVAKLFLQSGQIVLCSFVTPLEKDRRLVERIVGSENYYEFYLECDVTTCQERDTKGLYERAKKGDIEFFTGISAPYEPPHKPFLVCNSKHHSADTLTQQVLLQLFERKIFS